ncbi:MAG: ureidoglycolate lyase [Steroidobacteraceae bacterium]
MKRIELHPEPLSGSAFAPFGDVIDIAGRAARWINDGTCERFDDLAQVDVSADGGRPLISIFRAAPRSLPFEIRSLERHPLSSQAFYPLQPQPFLIVVAQEGSGEMAARVRAFVSNGRQGVNFRRNTWHHELLAMHQSSLFLVVDRGGPGENCESIAVDGRPVRVNELPSGSR